MPKTLIVPDDLFEQLGKLARPFVHKEPADVIRWLVEKQHGAHAENHAYGETQTGSSKVRDRAPRERGVVVSVDGTEIRAETVPDLIAKVMDLVFRKGKWNGVLRLAPYKTSTKRYLYSKTPKHPSGNDFWSEVRCRELYFEAHKNYKTAYDQLAKLLSKLGMVMTYKGT